MERERTMAGPLVKPQRLITGLLLMVGALAVGHLLSVPLGQWSWQFERLFCLDLESNLPTWFSSLLWAVTALAAYRCAHYAFLPRHRSAWMVMTCVLIFLSCDEVAMMHENFSRALDRRLFHGALISRFPVGFWPLIFGPAIGVGVIWLGRELRLCLCGSAAAGRRVALGIGLLLVGGMGFEMIANLLAAPSLTRLYNIEVLFEELFEMLGAIAILSGLLLHQRFLQGEAQ